MFFEVAQHLIERVTLAAEDVIITAMKAFLSEEQLMIEGAASVGLAVLLSEQIKLRDKKMVLVVIDRNIDSNQFLFITSQS